MSKNVAVFVDVANIFYAAKAAGVDIDYVTLLRSATAGRDFVRAYAYTGLDPDNENQRQFHGFLARSGYRVVSKDIRKYGDGRIKANLDIELVVDMMRMAEHLDIAVVVSGDGDFAPAIRAVQQMGVRVEVISFRGNTSSDLIEVADVFIDIGQIARVEKGVRSGRRVATEGDLSMTEVPDKEAGVTPRRRRPRRGEVDDRGERFVADEVEPEVPVAGLVALPGEKLSRAPLDGMVSATPGVASEDGVDRVEDDRSAEGAGDRRRRRRGGRGRGRGGRPVGDPMTGDPMTREPMTGQGRPGQGRPGQGRPGQGRPAQGLPAQGLPGEVLPEEIALDEAAATQFADEVPTLPQHSGFGSVWDRQIGVSPPAAAGSPGPSVSQEIEGFVDEPEVPEYLLAERRQQARRRSSPGGRARGGGGYRSAIDRERFGAGGAPGGYSGGRGGGGRSQGQPRWTNDAPAPQPLRQGSSTEPWSEVPPEVQELLRAEVARRQGGTAAGAAPAGGRGPTPEAAAPTDAAVEGPSGTPRADEPSRARAPRRRPAPPATEIENVLPAEAAPDATTAPTAEASEAAEVKKPRRTTRRRTTATPDESVAEAPPSMGSAEATPEAAAPEKPRRTTRRRASATPTDAEAGATEASEAAAPEKPRRTTRRRTSASDSTSDGEGTGASEGTGAENG